VNKISNSIAEISSSFDRLNEDALRVSDDAISLSTKAETLSEISGDYNFGSIHDVVRDVVVKTAKQIGTLFEEAVGSGRITESDLFDRDYKPIPSTSPQKFATRFDTFTDQVLPSIQEPILELEDEIILACAVDNNGYLPTHNLGFSKPLTGDHDVDFVGNRTKRIFDDRTGSRCGSNTQDYLLQTYKRDTGEILHDATSPIYVNGRHWGGFRTAYKS